MSRQFIQENLKTPVGYECDVLVAGGGTAGVVAALAAARNGAKTILIDRYGRYDAQRRGPAAQLFQPV
jgi:NADPH-dependent 2,4-dienoyl-CoA reductase/sulfur reductase-like enzyme